MFLVCSDADFAVNQNTEELVTLYPRVMYFVDEEDPQCQARIGFWLAHTPGGFVARIDDKKLLSLINSEAAKDVLKRSEKI